MTPVARDNSKIDPGVGLRVVGVGAMIDADHVHRPGGGVDAVDDAVRAAAGRVIADQFADQWLADPLGVVEQRSGDELGHGTRYCKRQADRWSFGQCSAGGWRQ